METRNKDLTPSEEVRVQWIGAECSPERLDYERSYELYKIGVMICQARSDRGMPEEQLAQKCGVTRGPDQ